AASRYAGRPTAFVGYGASARHIAGPRGEGTEIHEPQYTRGGRIQPTPLAPLLYLRKSRLPSMAGYWLGDSVWHWAAPRPIALRVFTPPVSRNSTLRATHLTNKDRPYD